MVVKVRSHADVVVQGDSGTLNPQSSYHQGHKFGSGILRRLLGPLARNQLPENGEPGTHLSLTLNIGMAMVGGCDEVPPRGEVGSKMST